MTYEFKYPLFLTATHMVASYLLAFVAIFVFNKFEKGSLDIEVEQSGRIRRILARQ